MFTQNANVPSLSDIAAVTGNNKNNDGWCGDGAWLIWLVLIFAMFGYGGFGFGGFGGNGSALQGYATQADIMRGFDNQTVVSKLDGISNGLCSLGYDQLSQMNNINQNISNGFNGVNRAICDVGYQTQNGFNTTNVALMQAQNALQTQLANCCCENREGQAQIRYDMATQACETRQVVQNSARDIIDNANANNRAILDFLVNDKIATLTAENNDLRRAASQDRQNALLTTEMNAQTQQIINAVRPTPVPSFPASNLYGYGYNGCCNTGCGC